MNLSLSGRLNSSIRPALSSVLVTPSSRRYLYPSASRNTSMMFRSCTIWLKSSTRWPAARSFGSTLKSSASLPEERMSCSRSASSVSPDPPPRWRSRNRYGWLQTFRSCIAVLLRLAIPPASSATDLHVMMSRYSRRCHAERPQ